MKTSVRACFGCLLICLAPPCARASETVLHSFSNNYLTDKNPIGQLAVYSGYLYGVTNGGVDRSTGTNRHATIFKMTKSGAVTVLHEFALAEGIDPLSGPVVAGGSLYGVMAHGGSDFVNGTLYKVAPSGAAFTVAHNFTGYNYANPAASDAGMPGARLLLASDERLYGVTEAGGIYDTFQNQSGDGAIFAFDPFSHAYSLLHSFHNDPDGGCRPMTGLAEGPDGALYGLIQHFNAADQYAYDYSALFKIKRDGSGYAIVHKFAADRSDPAGALPLSDVLSASDGNLYGVCEEGGLYGLGTVFRLTPSTGAVSPLWSPDGYAGAFADTGLQKALIQGSDGNLYGVTPLGGYYGYGTAFRVSLSGSANVLAHFNYWNTDGSATGLTQLGTSFFCVSYTGGMFCAPPNAYGEGAAVSISATGVVKDLVSFYQQDTYLPNAPLVQSGGYFFGEGTAGGEYGSGVIYKIDASGHYLLLHHLHDDQLYHWEGSSPVGGLVLARDGSFYGVCQSGGLYNGGTLFKVSASGTYTVLHHFNKSLEGSAPITGLSQGVYPDNNLYGTLNTGSYFFQGSVFASDTAGKNFRVLHYFTGSDGSGPQCVPLPDAGGNLYGTCFTGGAHIRGTLWKLSTTGATFTRLADLDDTHAGFPYAERLALVNGKLYGTGESGGSNNLGTIFSFDLATNTLGLVHSFNNVATEGGFPTGGVVYDPASGNLYGVCGVGGGAGKLGTIFKFNLAASSLTVLHGFSGQAGGDGSYPVYGPILGTDGLLHGTTPDGGLFDLGTVYSQTTAP